MLRRHIRQYFVCDISEKRCFSATLQKGNTATAEAAVWHTKYIICTVNLSCAAIMRASRVAMPHKFAKLAAPVAVQPAIAAYRDAS
jgi:hypothetical protein